MTLYTSGAVAQWFGLTERRIRQLRDEGVITEAQPGLYDLKDATRKYLTYLRNGSLADERAKLTRAKREAVEMENGLRRGTLHRTEDIEAGLSTTLLNVRGRLLVLPNKLAPALAALGGDQRAIFDALEQAIREALEELRSFDTAYAPEVGGENHGTQPV